MSFQIIQLFIGAQLTELCINPVVSSLDWRRLLNFLWTQTRLEKLGIFCSPDIPDDVELPLKLKCNVKELHTNVCNFQEQEVSVKFAQFRNLFNSESRLNIRSNSFEHNLLLMLQPTVELLSMDGSKVPPAEFYQLKRLRCEYVKKLILLRMKFNSDAKLVGFFSMFPNAKWVWFKEVVISNDVSDDAIDIVFRNREVNLFEC